MDSGNLWQFISSAGWVVKCVMLLLFAASILSWTFIFQRGLFLKKVEKNMKNFEDAFWSGTDLNALYDNTKDDKQGLSHIFSSGFAEFSRLMNKKNVSADAVMDGVQRSMRVANAHETDALELHLPFLATVGSTSPYVGLLGTVWGIMTAFHALGSMQQATIAMVAPGISEALIATAMGLFAAIPAVIAYNRFSHKVERLVNHYETFQEEFLSILHRQVHGNTLEG